MSNIAPSVVQGREITCIKSRLLPDECWPDEMQDLLQGLGGEYADPHYFITVLFSSDPKRLQELLDYELIYSIVSSTFKGGREFGLLPPLATTAQEAEVSFDQYCTLVKGSCCLFEIRNSSVH